MGTIPTGHLGLHVRPHVVSGSEPETGHAPILCPSSKGNHAKSRAWVCQTKLNIATCGSVEVCRTHGLENVFIVSRTRKRGGEWGIGDCARRED